MVQASGLKAEVHCQDTLGCRRLEKNPKLPNKKSCSSRTPVNIRILHGKSIQTPSVGNYAQTRSRKPKTPNPELSTESPTSQNGVRELRLFGDWSQAAAVGLGLVESASFRDWCLPAPTPVPFNRALMVLTSGCWGYIRV